MISAHKRDFVVAAIDQMMTRKAGQPFEELRRVVDQREALDRVGAVALADAGDQRLFRGEVAIEIARAHTGLTADVLHGGAVKAGARKAALGRIENFSPPVGLALWIGLPHVVPSFALRRKARRSFVQAATSRHGAPHLYENERSLKYLESLGMSSLSSRHAC